MLSFYVCALLTAASAFTSFGFSIAALLSAKGEAHTNTMYAVARSLALALISLVPLFYHAQPFLVAISLAMILVQVFDAFVGTRIRIRHKTFGPAALALANVLALGWLLQ
jgi:hypothetical protein